MSLLHYWDTQRSVKRRRTSEKDTDLESTGTEKRPPSPSPSSGAVDTPTPVPFTEEPDTYISSSQTELETSLPAIQTDEDAIKAYEASKAEQDADAEPGLHVRLRDGVWQRGKSSIYVDAFNLALETVLDEESHLFNEGEMEVFKQWKELSYESQYLYVLATPVTFEFPAVDYGVDLSLKICTAFPSENLCLASYQSIELLFRHLGLVRGSL